MTGTALVLGTNAGQADLIRFLKDAGWFVWACSGRAGEPGAEICDRFIEIDVADVDALAQMVNKNEIDLIYSISSDLAIRSATAVAEATGRPCFYDSAFVDLLDDKSALRSFLTDHGLDEVDFQTVAEADQAANWSRFPCIVKPVDAQGQRGVAKVEDATVLPVAVSDAIEASPSKVAIVEKLLKGVEVSCNVLVAGGEIKMQVLSERVVHTDIGFGIPAGHLLPPRNISKEQIIRANAKVAEIVAALGVRDGPLYFQMIITAEGPRVVEIAPRLDGCHIWRMIKLGLEFNLIEETVQALTGVV